MIGADGRSAQITRHHLGQMQTDDKEILRNLCRLFSEMREILLTRANIADKSCEILCHAITLYHLF